MCLDALKEARLESGLPFLKNGANYLKYLNKIKLGKTGQNTC